MSLRIVRDWLHYAIVNSLSDGGTQASIPADVPQLTCGGGGGSPLNLQVTTKHRAERCKKLHKIHQGAWHQ